MNFNISEMAIELKHFSSPFKSAARTRAEEFLFILVKSDAPQLIIGGKGKTYIIRASVSTSCLLRS